MSYTKLSQHLLNPFRGSMNIIQHKLAKAVSPGKICWAIYLRNRNSVKDLQPPVRIQTPCNAGWSKQHKLKGVAFYQYIIEEQNVRVYEHLVRHYHYE